MSEIFHFPGKSRCERKRASYKEALKGIRPKGSLVSNEKHMGIPHTQS